VKTKIEKTKETWMMLNLLAMPWCVIGITHAKTHLSTTLVIFLPDLVLLTFLMMKARQSDL
jgi:hypothetical protein